MIQLEAAPILWEPDLLDSKLEADLTASIDRARIDSLLRDYPAAPRPVLTFRESSQPQNTPSAAETIAASSHAQLIGGCGVAAVDEYLYMRDYAASKGLDLAEIHHKGIDLQDLISTLIINLQKQAEMEGRAGNQRYKR